MLILDFHVSAFACPAGPAWIQEQKAQAEASRRDPQSMVGIG